MGKVICHVLSRGVDKRKIFLDDEDRFRFIHDLFEFNDTASADNIWYHFHQSSDIASDIVSRYKESRERELLVDILAFCIMPNHYHLMLTEKVEGGMSLFMRKLNIGYAKYFNQKYKRKGTLFEGRYKSVALTSEAHFIHLPYYIHLNPLDLIMPEWRARKIPNTQGAMKFLEEYRWSSFLDYIGKKNFPSVISKDFLSEYFGGPKEYKKDTVKWLKTLDLTSVRNIALEDYSDIVSR